VPGRRVSSLLGALWNPDEPRHRIECRQNGLTFNTPARMWICSDSAMHWLVWFTAISMLLALLLREALLAWVL